MSTFIHKYRPPLIENHRDEFRTRNYGQPWPEEVPEGTERKRFVPPINTKWNRHLIDILRYCGPTALLCIENSEFNFSFSLNLDASELRELAMRALDAAHDLESNPNVNLNGDVQ